jgi:hypothetical protein
MEDTMANMRYFAVVNGQTVSFKNIDNRGREGRFGYHADSKSWIKIERVVEFKSNPTRHECDDRCIHATGRTMRCECSCGGKNHGKGH